MTYNKEDTACRVPTPFVLQVERASVMGKLILDSLEIQNFRAFKHLTIQKLGRVNLIVGKNNVGKTALLEALEIYSNRAATQTLQRIIANRHENRLRASDSPGRAVRDDPVSSFKHLFFGRTNINPEAELPVIKIIPNSSQEETLTLEVKWLTQQNKAKDKSLEEQASFYPALIIHYQDSAVTHNLLQVREYGMPEVAPLIEGISLPTRGFREEDIANLWGEIGLTTLERDVVTSLQTIAPDTERVSLLPDRNRYQPDEGMSNFVAVVKLAGQDAPIPLRSLGEGMNRMFGLALALVNAKDGLLLVDEIESGLHYSVQADMWKMVFETARRLNVQVFATTHSWDCIKAFQKAADDNEEDGMLIRLARNKKGDIVSTLFDEDELEIVTTEAIEVR